MNKFYIFATIITIFSLQFPCFAQNPSTGDIYGLGLLEGSSCFNYSYLEEYNHKCFNENDIAIFRQALIDNLLLDRITPESVHIDPYSFRHYSSRYYSRGLRLDLHYTITNIESVCFVYLVYDGQRNGLDFDIDDCPFKALLPQNEPSIVRVYHEDNYPPHPLRGTEEVVATGFIPFD